MVFLCIGIMLSLTYDFFKEEANKLIQNKLWVHFLTASLIKKFLFINFLNFFVNYFFLQQELLIKHSKNDVYIIYCYCLDIGRMRPTGFR